MKKLVVVFTTAVMLFSCGKKEKSGEDFSQPTTEETATADPSSYDPKRGEGKFKPLNLEPL